VKKSFSFLNVGLTNSLSTSRVKPKGFLLTATPIKGFPADLDNTSPLSLYHLLISPFILNDVHVLGSVPSLKVGWFVNTLNFTIVEEFSCSSAQVGGGAKGG
jgi:hypothetical protein